MDDTIRCPHCLGAKIVMKLGGMMGDCNTCKGKGTILAKDKPKPYQVTVEDVLEKELINAVSECVPSSDLDGFMMPTGIDEPPLKLSPDVKVDPKKAIYKRKRA